MVCWLLPRCQDSAPLPNPSIPGDDLLYVFALIISLSEESVKESHCPAALTLADAEDPVAQTVYSTQLPLGRKPARPAN